MEFCKELKVAATNEEGDPVWIRLSETLDRRSITLTVVDPSFANRDVTLTPSQFGALCDARYALDVKKTEDPEVKP